MVVALLLLPDSCRVSEVYVLLLLLLLLLLLPG